MIHYIFVYSCLCNLRIIVKPYILSIIVLEIINLCFFKIIIKQNTTFSVKLSFMR